MRVKEVVANLHNGSATATGNKRSRRAPTGTATTTTTTHRGLHHVDSLGSGFKRARLTVNSTHHSSNNVAAKAGAIINNATNHSEYTYYSKVSSLSLNTADAGPPLHLSAGELCLQRDLRELLQPIPLTTVASTGRSAAAWIIPTSESSYTGTTSSTSSASIVMRHAWRPCRLMRLQQQHQQQEGVATDCCRLRLELLHVEPLSSSCRGDDLTIMKRYQQQHQQRNHGDSQPSLIRIDLTFGRRYPHDPPQIQVLDSGNPHHRHMLPQRVILRDTGNITASRSHREVDMDGVTTVYWDWSPIRRLSELVDWLLVEFQDQHVHSNESPPFQRMNSSASSTTMVSTAGYFGRNSSCNVMCTDENNSFQGNSGESFLAPNRFNVGYQQQNQSHYYCHHQRYNRNNRGSASHLQRQQSGGRTTSCTEDDDDSMDL